jgi:hypothetical protein
MKGFRVLIVLCGAALLAAGCALPLGEDYLITRDGSAITYITDYNLLAYVPIPDTGKQPVIRVDNRGDLEAEVTWKYENGVDVPLPFEIFAANTMYQAEIRIAAKTGYGFYPSTPFAYPSGKIINQTNDLGDTIRTITVIYNNSDEAHITYITDYDLQNYVPVPMAGEKPVTTIDTREDLAVAVTWEVETSPGSGVFTGITPDNAFTFGLHKVYRAEITLTTKTGWKFRAARNFAYTDGTAVTPLDSGTEPGVRVLSVTYRATRTPTVIKDFNLTPYIPKPASGATAITSFAASQYTGMVIWRNSETQEVWSGPFQPVTAYTAELTLYPASGYTLIGVGQDAFIHTGAESINNPADKGTISMSFSPTSNYGSPTVVYDTILTSRLPKPVSGMTPVMGMSGVQYSGTVTWIPFHSAFQEGTAYKAVINLSAATGYTFTGIGQNVFSHDDAVGIVTNLADSGMVTINFPVTASSTYEIIQSFGPEEAADSALWLMKEVKDDTYPLAIDLLDNNVEVVIPNSVTLIAGHNSPASVIINGHHGTLKITSPGTLLTVGGGVTLTLQNITLEGYGSDLDPNNGPLVTIDSGGKLVLGTGAVLTGNHSAGNAGGVWVNGGTLILNNGGMIKNMSAASPESGGGVRVEANGKFFMNGGILGGEDPAGGNTVSGVSSGGGVYVDTGGSVDMSGGTIQYNSASAASSGGGVHLRYQYSSGPVVFNFYGGLITDNTAPGASSGGGVYVGGSTFTMWGAARVAEDNPVFLDGYEIVITIGGALSSNPAANIIADNPTAGQTRLVGASSRSLYIENYQKFRYEGATGHIQNEPSPYYSGWIGTYQD